MTVPALWTKHRPIAYAIARDYFIPGADRDDVRQEALIGLWIAARAYKKEKGPFPAFARVVVQRHLKDRVKAANRPKARLLTDADRTAEIADRTADETDTQLSLLVDALPTLSELERRALAASLNGQPITSKQQDNALQRARTKLRRAA